MGYLELAIFAFIILAWIIRTIYKGFRWLARQAETAGVTPSPIQQAIAEAQRQQAAGVPPPRPQAAPRTQTGLRSLPAPRRPEAGGPAVPREATRADFDRSERELLAIEPSALDAPLRSTPPNPADAPIRLFQNTDDLVRALILQEVLGPPLSRRSSR